MSRVRMVVLISVVLLLTVAAALPAGAQAEFTCNDGTGVVISNGVEFSANIRPGSYTAAVIGLNGFDPVMAVIDPASGDHLCNDDDPGAASIAASLPSTGDVPASILSAGLLFSNDSEDFLDVVLLVSDRNGASGEFILVFQGMQVTAEDGDGDSYSVNGSPNVVNSGVGIHAYVIHVDSNFDPVLKIVDENNEVVDVNGLVQCDDASNPSTCWPGDSTVVSLEGSGFTDGSATVVGDPYDSALFVSPDLLDPTTPYEQAYINYLVTGAMYQQGMSTGEYVFAIHTGVDEGSTTGTTGTTGNTGTTGTTGMTTAADVTVIDCAATGTQIEGDINSILNVECPANCTSGSLWGTGTYTDDSAICTAAIHTGIIPASGGQFTVMVAAGLDEYVGSTANGITSSSWGTWERSIVPMPLETSGTTTNSTGDKGSATPAPAGGAQTLAVGDTLEAQVVNSAGDSFVLTASAGDVISIAANSDAFDPLLIVTDMNQRELARDDDSGPGFNALIANLRIPNDGDYLVTVSSFGGTLEVGAPFTIAVTAG